jgi:hypothetical protein
MVTQRDRSNPLIPGVTTEYSKPPGGKPLGAQRKTVRGTVSVGMTGNGGEVLKDLLLLLLAFLQAFD